MRIRSMDSAYEGYSNISVNLELIDINGEDLNRLKNFALSRSRVTIAPDSVVEWNRKGKPSIDIKVTKVIHHNPATIVFFGLMEQRQ